jgi:hypothetical protein
MACVYVQLRTLVLLSLSDTIFNQAKVTFAFSFLLLVLTSGCVSTTDEAPPEQVFTLTAPGIDTPYTGRVYVVIAPKSELAPIYTNYWFSPIELFAKDVQEWDGKEPLLISEKDLYFKRDWPKNVEELSVQGVIRTNQRHWHPLIGVGNRISAEKTFLTAEAYPASLALQLDNTNEVEWTFWDGKEKTIPKGIDHFTLKSELLSKFHGSHFEINVSVQLPKDYEARDQWPVLYYISGMGGNELAAISFTDSYPDVLDEVILVSADAMNYAGHSVFANSDVIGPWADFFATELVEHIEKSYHTSAKNYLTGGSSGGWSSLWLQLNYPDTFDGTWSFVPDPVDFRDFLQVDLYSENVNLFYDSLGGLRPAARNPKTGQLIFTLKEMASIEQVLGEGAQLGSLNSVFGIVDEKASAQGSRTAMPLFDVKSGRINPSVIEHWKQYDIRLLVQDPERFSAQSLSGKLNIVAGQYDNYYLEGAVELLREQFAEVGFEPSVRIVADMGHSIDDDTIKRMLEIIAENERVHNQE